MGVSRFGVSFSRLEDGFELDGYFFFKARGPMLATSLVRVADVVVLALNLAVMVAVGLYCSWKNRSVDAWLFAGRRMSGWIVASSFRGFSRDGSAVERQRLPLLPHSAVLRCRLSS